MRTSIPCNIVHIHSMRHCHTTGIGYHYWESWRDFIGPLPTGSDSGTYATFRETGMLMFKHNATRSFLDTTTALCSDVGVPFTTLDRHELDRRYGASSALRMQMDVMGPPRVLEDPLFGTTSTEETITGGVLFTKSGYVQSA